MGNRATRKAAAPSTSGANARTDRSAALFPSRENNSENVAIPSATPAPASTASASPTHAGSASKSAPARTSDLRRAEIIEAARELYQTRGLERTTVKDITEKVGVARSLFYHYFPDKDAVTSAVLDNYIADFVEALQHWNEERREGDIDHALMTVVRLLRLGLFENDGFRLALTSSANASLYLEFANRVADHTASYLIETTVRDYASLHQVQIDHLYEMFYVLIYGMIGYLRQHPDADDAVIADLIAQTLHLDRP